MSKKKLKNQKLAITVVCITLSGGLLLGLSTILGQQSVTSLVANELSEVEQAEKSVPKNGMFIDEPADTLYKDHFYGFEVDEELETVVKQQTCEKFDLDYETVLLNEISIEMYRYEQIVRSKLKYGDLTLLSDGTGKESVESIAVALLGDNYIEAEKKEAVLTAAKAAGFDLTTTKIKDLSDEQAKFVQEQGLDYFFAYNAPFSFVVIEPRDQSDEEIEVN